MKVGLEDYQWSFENIMKLEPPSTIRR
jgi:hypothetical protein